MRRVFALLVCAAAGAAADDDPVDILARVRDRVVEQGNRMPNHTCVETVERQRYQRVAEQSHRSCDAILARRQQPNFSKLLRLSTTDRLRLDVAVTRGSEIYSWAGAGKFEEGEIDDLIPVGSMGTGAFSTLLESAFEARSSGFTFDGVVTLASRTLYKYSFHVPKDESLYKYRENHKPWIITGYGGELLVDPRTSELVRLSVHTDELPPTVQGCEIDTTLDYGEVQLSGADFLLPASTRQRFISRDGREEENSYTFSACRDFQAESNVHWGDDNASTAGGRAGDSATPQWPLGTPVSIDVTTPIDGRAAAGDRIEGRLAQAIHNPKGGPAFARGTAVVGRLMRVEVRHQSPAAVTIVLRWEALQSGGQTIPLSLMPVRAPRPVFRAGCSVCRVEESGERPRPGEERYGVFHFPGENVSVKNGLRTEWVTANP
jgi:hypothetical protein